MEEMGLGGGSEREIEGERKRKIKKNYKERTKPKESFHTKIFLSHIYTIIITGEKNIVSFRG